MNNLLTYASKYTWATGLAMVTLASGFAAATCPEDSASKLLSLVQQFTAGLTHGRAQCNCLYWLGMASQLCAENRENYSAAAATLMNPIFELMAKLFERAARDFTGATTVPSALKSLFADTCKNNPSAITTIAQQVINESLAHLGPTCTALAGYK